MFACWAGLCPASRLHWPHPSLTSPKPAWLSWALPTPGHASVWLLGPDYLAFRTRLLHLCWAHLLRGPATPRRYMTQASSGRFVLLPQAVGVTMTSELAVNRTTCYSVFSFFNHDHIISDLRREPELRSWWKLFPRPMRVWVGQSGSPPRQWVQRLFCFSQKVLRNYKTSWRLINHCFIHSSQNSGAHRVPGFLSVKNSPWHLLRTLTVIHPWLIRAVSYSTFQSCIILTLLVGWNILFIH